MKIRAMVYSANQYFLDSLNNYVMTSVRTGLTFFFFKEEEAAINFLGDRRLDMILADESFLQKNTVPEDVVKICISNRTQLETQGKFYELNIYQRGRDILGDMLKILTEAGWTLGQGENGFGQVISFYSPQGGSGKTTLAYICAMLCGRYENVVYLNLEDFGSTSHLYQAAFGAGAEDILSVLKDRDDPADDISKCLQKDSRNVSVMPSITICDSQMSSDDVERLVKTVQKVSDADYVFVDLSGSLTPQNKKVLALSTCCFWVFDDTDVGRGKMELVRNDRSLQETEYFDRSYFLLNKWRSGDEDVCAVRIPWSDSLFNGAHVEKALSGEKDFSAGCMEIVTMIYKQRKRSAVNFVHE